jgi:serine/threonine protein kinase
MRSCPSDQFLRMLAEDELGSVIFDAIEKHIAECPDCRARLESLARECPEPTTSPIEIPPQAGDLPSIPGLSIEKEIGRGAMGVVYLARQDAVGRHVAIKVMYDVPGADQSARKRWRKEAKAFSSVRHPNVVSLHDVGEERSWLYLVLEYIPGRTLKDRLEGPLRPREAARLMVTIAEAVHHIHQAGLLHLDLKPSNILIDSEPDTPLDRVTPKVADFGIARFLADSERTGTGITHDGSWAGTPSYMAPEQVEGTRDQLGPTADVHALGAILYRLVTGVPPYQGATEIETLNDLRNCEPVPPRRLTPRLSRDLETIILKCLRKDPIQRYPTAQEHAEEKHRGTHTGGSDGTGCFATRASPRTLRAGHLARARGDGHQFRATTRAHGLRSFHCPL